MNTHNKKPMSDQSREKNSMPQSPKDVSSDSNSRSGNNVSSVSNDNPGNQSDDGKKKVKLRPENVIFWSKVSLYSVFGITLIAKALASRSIAAAAQLVFSLSFGLGVLVCLPVFAGLYVYRKDFLHYSFLISEPIGVSLAITSPFVVSRYILLQFGKWMKWKKKARSLAVVTAHQGLVWIGIWKIQKFFLPKFNTAYYLTIAGIAVYAATYVWFTTGVQWDDRMALGMGFLGFCATVAYGIIIQLAIFLCRLVYSRYISKYLKKQ